MNSIYPIYFTCSNHFNELICSVRSLTNIGCKNLKQIQVFCDLTDFFDQKQIDELNKYSCVVKKTLVPLSWGGTNIIESELLAFSQTSKEINSNDYIMNIDSDLIFIYEDILNIISNSSEDLIGQPISFVFHASWNNHLCSDITHFHQGACYFVKASFATKLLATYYKNKQTIVDLIKKTCFVPENTIPPDVTVHTAMKMANGTFKGINFFVENKSVIHLELTKDKRWIPFAKTLGINSIGKHSTNNSTPIPKTIHYCWFGKKEKTDLVKKCIQSWKKIMPDYNIKEWNEDNSPMNHPYVQYSYENKRFSNVANFVRLYALYNEGGIYLDSDIEVVKRFDDLLVNKCFLGFQFKNPPLGTGSEMQWVNNAVIGSVQGFWFMEATMNLLNSDKYKYRLPPNGPDAFTEQLVNMGLEYCANSIDNMTNIKGITIYPMEYFYPFAWNEPQDSNRITKNTYSIHYWNKMWKN